MIDVHCRACGASWSSPEAIGPEEISQVADAFRRHGGIGGIKALRDCWGLSLRDAKAIVLHIVSEPDRCHRCKTPLEGQTVSVCGKCGSVNYNW